MPENDAAQHVDEPPMAVTKTTSQRGFSPIWIVPIVALLIGAFLIYRVVSETGPTITISFKEATGLVAGKTKVKFKDVDVGQVADVQLKPDLSGIDVTVNMKNHTGKYMTDKTRFWVVRPQITAGNISGLGTLLSGDYIGMDPSTEGNRVISFVGLERPPVIRGDESGSYYKLRSKRLGGLSFGSPVYFRQITAGSVVDYESGDDGDILLEIFIKEPYVKHINAATRFWNASGFDVRLSTEGLEVDTESLVSIIAGGIAFDTIDGLGRDAATSVPDAHEFTLYPSRAASRLRTFRLKRKVLFYFEDSVRGLLPGAPVELKGYQIGEVVDVSFEFDREASTFKIPVLAEIEPERVIVRGESSFQRTMSHLVANGLRAQLKTGNLVLGKQLVSLDLHPDAPPATVESSEEYLVIPTLRGTLGEIAEDAQALIAELRNTGEMINTFLKSKAFTDGVEDLSATLDNIKLLTAQLDEETAPRVSAVLEDAEATLEEARTMLATNSTTRTEMNRLLTELTEAARSIRLLADYLEQHPESLIKGKD